MKKQTEQNTNATATPKQKRQRVNRTFFLYNEGKGFLAYDNEGMPTFDCDKELMRFTSMREAKFAANFCKQLHLAEAIDIMAKVG